MGAPSAAEVRVWMTEEGRGYKAAGKHFGVSAETLRKLCKATSSRAGVRAGATHDPEIDWASEPADKFWSFIVNTGITKAAEEKGIAAKDHLRTAMDARKMLDLCRPDVVKQLTAEEADEQLDNASRDWPERAFRIVLANYMAQHNAETMTMRSPGRTAVFDGERWLQVVGEK